MSLIPVPRISNFSAAYTGPLYSSFRVRGKFCPQMLLDSSDCDFGGVFSSPWPIVGGRDPTLII